MGGHVHRAAIVGNGIRCLVCLFGQRAEFIQRVRVIRIDGHRPLEMIFRDGRIAQRQRDHGQAVLSLCPGTDSLKVHLAFLAALECHRASKEIKRRLIWSAGSGAY